MGQTLSEAVIPNAGSPEHINYSEKHTLFQSCDPVEQRANLQIRSIIQQHAPLRDNSYSTVSDIDAFLHIKIRCAQIEGIRWQNIIGVQKCYVLAARTRQSGISCRTSSCILLPNNLNARIVQFLQKCGRFIDTAVINDDPFPVPHGLRVYGARCLHDDMRAVEDRGDDRNFCHRRQPRMENDCMSVPDTEAVSTVVCGGAIQILPGFSFKRRVQQAIPLGYLLALGQGGPPRAVDTNTTPCEHR